VPLAAYGVVIGDIVSFDRDPPDAYGRWYHGHLKVSTPSGIWESALDVDTPTGLGVRYRTSYSLAQSTLGPVSSLADGFHLLASAPTTGAIDYLRSFFLQDILFTTARIATLGLRRIPRALPPLSGPFPPTPTLGPIQAPGALPRSGLGPGPGPMPGPDNGPAPGIPPRDPVKPPINLKELILRFLGWIHWILPIWIPLHFRPWILSDGDNALTTLEQHAAVGRRAFLFGERYTTGNGVHDVHQNQGDPAGSQWWAQNGIWQDGAVGVVQSDGTLFFWQVRFESQAMRTDANGHPA
jgi:hypothetical protein